MVPVHVGGFDFIKQDLSYRFNSSTIMFEKSMQSVTSRKDYQQLNTTQLCSTLQYLTQITGQLWQACNEKRLIMVKLVFAFESVFTEPASQNLGTRDAYFVLYEYMYALILFDVKIAALDLS
ncbi:hypothetical protein ACLBWZ_03520 [Brucellaceae bacterium C25G]